MKMRSPFLIKISLCVIMLLFVCDRVANAQDVAPENGHPKDVVPELTPDEEVPWEEVTKKKMPDGAAPEAVVPEAVIVAEDYIVPNEHKMAVMLIVGAAGDSQSITSGFACKFKNRECIATNLHVIEEASAITVTSLSGNPIGLSDQMFVSEDANICLLAIKGSFAELGIVPFEFMDDVLKGSKLGDEIICLGNSPGDGVITTTKGNIKTLGQSSVQTDAPTVNGNSGGPMIHRDSSKVISLVAQAGETTCSGHRVDVVKKWRSITFSEFKKSSLVIANARGNLDIVYNFLNDKPGWRNDRSLANAWDTYEKFLEEKVTKPTKEAVTKNPKETVTKTTKEIEVTEKVDEFASFTARISRMKGKGVSQGDYDKARLSVIKTLDWKIQSTQDVIIKSTPIGPRQIQAINELKSDTQQLADAIGKL